MAKYSTGRGGGGGDGDACELCGKESGTLRKENVAGANLLVCRDCAPMGENRSKDRKKREMEQGSRGEEQMSRKKRAARNTAKMLDAGKGSAKHWEEEGTDYEKDRLPYLVSGYGSVVEQARQEKGWTAEELADRVEADEEQILAVEEGRATRAGVGGSLIRKLEQELGVDLVDE
jgi:ribosome-binding protein aMBF1 (putative translation factor)